MARNHGNPRLSHEPRPYADAPDEDRWYDRWISYVADEVASNMPGEEAREERMRDLRDRFNRMRRRLQPRPAGYRGLGPRGYVRADERIYEEVNERLTTDRYIDATEVEASVAEGVVTLNGMVENRAEKRLAEDCVDTVPGVRDVNNNLRIRAAERARRDRDEQREGMGGRRTAI